MRGSGSPFQGDKVAPDPMSWNRASCSLLNQTFLNPSRPLAGLRWLFLPFCLGLGNTWVQRRQEDINHTSHLRLSSALQCNDFMKTNLY